jgi:hypothetical protein
LKIAFHKIALEIRYYTRYISPRTRALTLEESCIRRIAYELKIPTRESIQAAALGMAELLDEGPCWLIPIPSSSGTTEANLTLCHAIRKHHPEARIVIGVRRTHPVDSSCVRRRSRQMGLTVKQHAFQRCCPPLLRLQVWFVDNVVTTGTTIQAAHLAFGTGRGLVYADASSCAFMRKLEPPPHAQGPPSFWD